MNGSFMIVNCVNPLEIDASRSGLPPAGTIFTSLSGSIPKRFSDNFSPMSEMLPARLTEPVLPRNCSTVVIFPALMMWSMKVGMIDRIITKSAPPSRGLTTLGAEVTTTSKSPATSACIAGGPAPKKIGSVTNPCLAKKPRSCATHNGVCDAVIAAHPTRTRSWAELSWTFRKTINRVSAVLITICIKYLVDTKTFTAEAQRTQRKHSNPNLCDLSGPEKKSIYRYLDRSCASSFL
jgi:hypothetical protein